MSLKQTIEDMRQLAAERGGNCLSDVYIDSLSEHYKDNQTKTKE